MTTIIKGTSEGDNLFGGNDNDLLEGNLGDDLLSGGYYNDSLEGDSGDDQLFGGEHDDSLKGDSGDDRLFGGDHNDLLEGGSGDDILFGGYHDDFLEGGSGNDSLTGDAGQDTLTGGDGADSFIITSLDSLNTIVDFDSAQGDMIVFDTAATGVSEISDLTVFVGSSYNHTSGLTRMTSLYVEDEKIVEFDSVVSLEAENFEFV